MTFESTPKPKCMKPSTPPPPPIRLSGRSSTPPWKGAFEAGGLFQGRGEDAGLAVREVFGLPASTLSDDEAIALALDPSKNKYLGETLNVTTHSKISRALFHPHYTFRKKISHTGDSQDQRHRMTPASRPILHALTLDEPDYLFRYC